MTQDTKNQAELGIKDLKDAVIYAMCFGPLKPLTDRAPTAIQDFLRERFKNALARAINDSERVCIHSLWRDISGEDTI